MVSSASWSADSAETWAARGAATVSVPYGWTVGDVTLEAAEMWEDGWEPGARGGAPLFVSPADRTYSLGDMFEDADDDSWPAFADAVWTQLVDVCEAMTMGNRQRRRATRKLHRGADR